MLRAKGTDRLLDVLDCVASRETPMTRNAIAAAIRAPRSTIYSIIELMLRRDYLEQIEPEGLIVPGGQCGLLGLSYGRENRFGRKARNVVAKLAQRAGEVAELNIMRVWRQVVLISETGRSHHYRVPVEGSSTPLPQAASGRFLLQGVDRSEMAANLSDADLIMADGSRIDLARFCEDMEVARRQGYWIARGLIDPYIACIASPVQDRSQRCIGAVCLVVPLPELARREEELISMTREAADELTRICLSSHVASGDDLGATGRQIG
jgi:DNA-binding IclR family transcriptional regulator